MAEIGSTETEPETVVSASVPAWSASTHTSHAPSGSVTDVAALFGLKITKMPSDVLPFTPPLIRNASTLSSRPSTEVMFALTSSALVRRSAAWALRKAISPL